MKVFIIIKPDGVKKKLVGECLRRFEHADLKLEYLQVLTLKKFFIRKFYSHLKNRLEPQLFESIVSYLCSGPVIVMVMEGVNAVQKSRNIGGPTNPAVAPKGTIRGDFATDDLAVRIKLKKAVRNIVHISGTPQEARDEIRMFFKAS
jgi:nucleoside-diphosphate kinase